MVADFAIGVAYYLTGSGSIVASASMEVSIAGSVALSMAGGRLPSLWSKSRFWRAGISFQCLISSMVRRQPRQKPSSPIRHTLIQGEAGSLLFIRQKGGQKDGAKGVSK